MKNLITGGAGFIGSHLIDKLLSKGEQIICVDNFSTGSLENISHLIDNPNFQLIKQDICDPLDLKIDKIWHFACPASRIHYERDPIKTSKTNFIGTYNMLDLARRNNANFLLASSSEVYGEPNKIPQEETLLGLVNPICKKACYAEGKRIAESLCADFMRVHNLEIRIARIFNTYGPRMQSNDGRVISNFIFNALRDKPIKVYGTGQQTRSFCFVDDLTEGLIKLMNANYMYPVNLGNPFEYFTILELLKIIVNKIKTNSRTEFCEPLSYDQIRRKPCIKLASKILKWEPKIDLNDGLEITISELVKKF